MPGMIRTPEPVTEISKLNSLSYFTHHVKVKGQIVNRGVDRVKVFPGQKQVPQIRPAVPAADRTIAFGIDRPGIIRVNGVFDQHPSL
jgi:hypothetical protein